MPLNDSHMLPERVRSMRQMKDVLDVEDIVLAEIESIIDRMHDRAARLHEELVNEAWLAAQLEQRTGADTVVTAIAEELLARIRLDVSHLQFIASNIRDIRGFIEKWLPAHLCYLLILQAGYVIDATELESAALKRVCLKTAVQFWEGCYLLDGSWHLDGTRHLNAHRRYMLILSAAYRFKAMSASQLALDMAGAIRTTVRTDIGMSAWIGMNIDVMEDISRMKASGIWHSWVYQDGIETVTGQDMIVKTHDCWSLNGSVRLDGCRKLNAIYYEEEM